MILTAVPSSALTAEIKPIASKTLVADKETNVSLSDKEQTLNDTILSSNSNEELFENPVTQPKKEDNFIFIANNEDNNLLNKQKVELPPPAIKKVEINMTDNMPLDEYLYGYSVYYQILKKYNRLDLLGKIKIQNLIEWEKEKKIKEEEQKKALEETKQEESQTPAEQAPPEQIENTQEESAGVDESEQPMENQGALNESNSSDGQSSGANEENVDAAVSGQEQSVTDGVAEEQQTNVDKEQPVDLFVSDNQFSSEDSANVLEINQEQSVIREVYQENDEISGSDNPNLTDNPSPTTEDSETVQNGEVENTQQNDKVNADSQLVDNQNTSEVDPAQQQIPPEDALNLGEPTEDQLLTMIMEASSDKAWYNTLIGPSTMNGVKNDKFSSWTDIDETVSPQTGDLSLKQDEILLPGRNGLDLSIGTLYQSNQALFGDRRYTYDDISYSDYGTYLLRRYALGVGWAFKFPSVQVETDEGRTELYYHTGDGHVYHVNFTSDSSDSNLEDYYLKDVIFDNDTNFTNEQGVVSQYSFTSAEKTKTYFAADGRLLGIVDRFGNTIKFKHNEAPVTNSAPNNDFENSENVGVWTVNNYFSYDQNFGKDDNTSYRFNGNTSSIANSKYIPVNTNTKYYYGVDINDQLTTGQAKLYIQEYDENYNLINQSNFGYLSPTQKNTWEHLTETFLTQSNTRYVKLLYEVTGGNGSCWIDKLRFDRTWPLISEITDSIGRKITFTYDDKLYDEDNVNYSAGNVTVSIKDPSQSKETILTYDRRKVFANLIHSAGTNTWQEQLIYPRLYSFNDGEITKNYYDYNYPKGYYNFASKTKDTSSDNYCPEALLETYYNRNELTKYTYGLTTKHMGENGYYETHRITNRYDQYARYINDTWVYEGNDYQKNYTYNGVYNGTNYDNEIGFPGAFSLAEDPNYVFTTTMQQNNGLIEKYTYHGKRQYQEEKWTSGGTEKKITTFQSYDSTFLESPTEAKVEQVSPGGTKTLLIGYTYNDWGGIASETDPLTQEQWNNTTLKNQHTTSYTYDNTYKLPASTNYFQNPDRQLTETISYDSLGRAVSTTNAKGEIAEYQYEDTQHPGNITKETIHNENGNDTIIDYDYSGAQYAFPTTITTHYTDVGEEKSSIEQRSYELLWGNITSSTDPMGNIANFDYDGQGRLIQVTYPQVAGKDGNYVVKENYEYNNYWYHPLLDNRLTLEVYSFKTKTPAGGNDIIVAENWSLYDEHGNLHLSRDWDFERQDFISTIYGYNSYGQLIWSKDPANNQTYYGIDEWDRLKEVSNPQGDYYRFVYDSFNQTKTTYFVTQATGYGENHLVETYDQWNNTVSRKGYPDGINNPPIEETYEYDINGNMTKLTDPKGNITLFEYDALDRLVKVTDALGNATDYDYNRLGNLKLTRQYQNSKILATSKSYDERGLLTSEQPPAGNPYYYTYDAAGNMKKFYYPTGKVIDMTYDALNRLSEKKDLGLSNSIKYLYNHNGSVEKYQISLGTNEPLEYEFFSTGLTSKRKQNGIFSTDFQYDILGNRTRVTDPFGLNIDYTYDSLNRLSNVLVDGKTFNYEYYPDGMVKAVESPPLNNGVKIRTEYTYDNLNRLKTLVNKIGTNIISQYSYLYDNNSNITSVTENGTATTSYEYSELNQLIKIIRPDGKQISYQYDTRGNRVQGKNNTSELDGLISGEFTYNSWEELATFITNSNTYNYSYDPEGLRIKKTGPSLDTRYHYNNNGQVIAESDFNNQVTAQNIYGMSALARKIGNNYYYYIYNGHGDIVQVIDENGNIVNRYAYDEWGKVITKEEQIINPIRYAGEYYDNESGLYYLRSRYYDPNIGGFISRDSDEGSITNPLTLNLYSYCANNPVNFIDPTGHYSQSVIKKIVAVCKKYTEAAKKGNKTGMAEAQRQADEIRYSTNKVTTPSNTGRSSNKSNSNNSSEIREKVDDAPKVASNERYHPRKVNQYYRDKTLYAGQSGVKEVLNSYGLLDGLNQAIGSQGEAYKKAVDSGKFNIVPGKAGKVVIKGVPIVNAVFFVNDVLTFRKGYNEGLAEYDKLYGGK